METTCKKCGAERVEVGGRYKCKPCKAAADAAYYRANAEAIKEYSKQWRLDNLERVKANDRTKYLANAEKVKARSRKRYAENTEAVRAVNDAYRKANPEKVKARTRKYYLANKEASMIASAAWAKANPEKRKEIVARWSKANPESTRAGCRKRRALLRGVTGPHHIAADVEALFFAQNGLCAYCFLDLDSSYHVDHIQPLSRGGGNGPENICLACPPCNLAKANRLLLVEWLPPSVVNFPLTGIVT